MNFIEKVFCLNIPGQQSEIEMNFRKEKNICFLTGHNGVGKTKILKAIHGSLCSYHDNSSFHVETIASGYSMILEFQNSVRFFTTQLDMSSARENEKEITKNIDDVSKKICSKMNWNKAVETLKEAKQKFIHQDESAVNFNTKISNRGILTAQASRTPVDIGANIPNSLFFSYDKVHYSGNKEDTTKVQSLDNYLQLTLERFKQKPQLSNNDSLFSDVAIDNLLENLKLKNNLEDSEIQVARKILKSNILNESRKVENDDVLEVLNIFFRETGRELIYDKEEVIKCKILATDQIVSWRDLSKGEKSIIFLYFSVYFYSDDNVLFLIDEPEISLHISWQEKLIKNLIKLSPNSQFIIATHAPSIVFKTEQEQYFNLENIQNVSK